MIKKELFVADTENHCIRRVDISLSYVTTWAGECGSSGFKDGPIGVNRFNAPNALGIDRNGNLVVNDSGNKYVRLVTPEGEVKTLIQGACYEYLLEFQPNNKWNYRPKTLLCFK